MEILTTEDLVTAGIQFILFTGCIAFCWWIIIKMYK